MSEPQRELDDNETVWWLEADNGKEGYVHLDPYCPRWEGVDRTKTSSGPLVFAQTLELCPDCASGYTRAE